MLKFILPIISLLVFTVQGIEPMVLEYIYPAGCRRGESCEVVVGGNWGGNKVGMGFSGVGISAEYVSPEYISVLKTGKSKSKRRKKKYVKQALPGHSRINVNVDQQTESGFQEFFVDYRYEVSTPLKFEVSDYIEIIEPLTNVARSSVMKLTEMPVCINGRSYKDVADRFEFEAAEGQSFVAYMKSELIPPGGFVPLLQIANSAGVVITNAFEVYCEESAPALVFKVPASGTYALLVSGDGKQRWRSAVYRLVFGQLPLITGFSPSMAVRGESVNVRLEGVNLGNERVRLFTGGKDSAMCLASITADAYILPDLDFKLVDEEIVTDTEPNNTMDEAQLLAVPVVVRGKVIPGQDDSDFYTFKLPAGIVMYLDIDVPFSFGSGLPDVKLRDIGGEILEPVQNMPSVLRGVVSAAPVSYRCDAEDGGSYTLEVTVGDRVRSAGCIYSLRIGLPRPDFHVWMTPASLNIPMHGSCLVNLYLHRVHGFDQPVSVAAAFPPLGILSGGGVIGGDEVEGLVTVWTDGYRNPRKPFHQELAAVSVVDGTNVSKPVTPVLLPDGEGGSKVPMFVSKPPARVAYYQPGMCIDTGGKSTLVFDQKESREVKLFFKKIKGSVAEDYRYSVIEPAGRLIIKDVSESPADHMIRLVMQNDKKRGFKEGDSGFLIIGMKPEDSKEDLTAVSQAVPFKVVVR
jgi:hypothetical protein